MIYVKKLDNGCNTKVEIWNDRGGFLYAENVGAKPDEVQISCDGNMQVIVTAFPSCGPRIGRKFTIINDSVSSDSFYVN